MKGGSEPIRVFLPPRPLLHSTGGLADPARHPHPQSLRVRRGPSLAPGSKAILPEATVPSQAHFLAQTQNSGHSSCKGTGASPPTRLPKSLGVQIPPLTRSGNPGVRREPLPGGPVGSGQSWAVAPRPQTLCLPEQAGLPLSAVPHEVSRPPPAAQPPRGPRTS